MPDIVNANDLPQVGESFLLVGPGGTGKTTAGLTLPRPTLFIFFDPNGPASVRGFDVDCISFFPEDTGIVKITPKNVKAREQSKYIPNTLNRFIAWFNAAAADGTLAKYSSIVFDSTTWFETAIYEDVMFERGRFGQPPDKDDYAQIRDNLIKALYPIAGIAGTGRHLVVTSHRKDKTNQGGDVTGQEIMLIGLARQTAPTLFANVFATEYIHGTGPQKTTGERYVAYTRPSSLLGLGRTAQKRRRLPYELDLTVKDWDNPGAYGLGKLIAEIEAGQHAEITEENEDGERESSTKNDEG